MTEASDHVDGIIAAWRRERPDIDTTPQGLIGRVHRLAAHLDTAIAETLARFDLTQGEFDVLATLRRAGAPYTRTAGELAEHTMISSGGLTKRVDRLEARGLLSRIADPDDARRRSITLTPRGRALVDEAFTAHLANEHRLIAGIATDAPELEPILRRWLLSLERRA